MLPVIIIIIIAVSVRIFYSLAAVSTVAIVIVLQTSIHCSITTDTVFVTLSAYWHSFWQEGTRSNSHLEKWKRFLAIVEVILQ